MMYCAKCHKMQKRSEMNKIRNTGYVCTRCEAHIR